VDRLDAAGHGREWCHVVVTSRFAQSPSVCTWRKPAVHQEPELDRAAPFGQQAGDRAAGLMLRPSRVNRLPSSFGPVA
jgi:hypothetical protein